MGFKPPTLKREELEQKIREEDAAKEVAHEEEVKEKAKEVRKNRPVSMQDDGEPAKGHTEGTMSQWMFTVSNQLAEQGNILRELKTLLQTLVLQVNRGQEKLPTIEQAAKALSKGEPVTVTTTPEEKAAAKKAAEKTAAEVLANNKHKNGKPPPVVDVPSLDVIAAQLGKYIKKHGKAAAETRLAQYKVKKAGELTDEQKPLFLQDIAT